jgi:hemolysin-activating ACP:hemolysin acyltransferase
MIWGKGKDAKGKDAKAKGGDAAASANSAAPANSGAPRFDPAAEVMQAVATPAANAAADAAKSGAGKAMSAAAQHAQFAQLFSQAVAVLMRDPNYKNLPLHELEYLLPPIITGQCAIANAKAAEGGPYVPVALALWARVSPTVDKRLSENLDKNVSLKTSEWSSGDIPWLITLAGAPKALPGFVKQLCDKQFNGQKVKMRGTDPSGKRIVQYVTAGSTPAA